jgi:DNA polymerase alpha subunit A
VVDDGVAGYMDNGMDDWMSGDNEGEESEDDVERRKNGV